MQGIRRWPIWMSLPSAQLLTDLGGLAVSCLGAHGSLDAVPTFDDEASLGRLPIPGEV